LHEPIPLSELPCSLELGRLVALTHLELALSHLKLALLLSVLRVPPLVLQLLGAHRSGTGLFEFVSLSLRGAASGGAVAWAALNRRRDLRALILPVVMIVLAVLRLRRCGNDKERRRSREYPNALHRSSIRSTSYITRYPAASDVCRVLGSNSLRRLSASSQRLTPRQSSER